MSEDRLLVSLAMSPVGKTPGDAHVAVCDGHRLRQRIRLALDDRGEAELTAPGIDRVGDAPDRLDFENGVATDCVARELAR